MGGVPGQKSLETADNIVTPIDEPDNVLPFTKWQIKDQMIAVTRKDSQGGLYVFLVNNNIEQERTLRVRLDGSKVKGDTMLVDQLDGKKILPDKNGVYLCPKFGPGSGRIFKVTRQ